MLDLNQEKSKDKADDRFIKRPRRLRLNQNIRDLVEETKLNSSDFIYPVFVLDGNNLKSEIKSMPGIHRWSIDLLLEEIKSIIDLGIKSIALFPVIDPSKKSEFAEESFNPDGLTQIAIKKIKEKFPELILVTDVALDPYTTHGHDGILALDQRTKKSKILNDETVDVLSKMALAQALAGSDIVAPSDMMDGRIAAIRKTLDENNFEDLGIMAYSAKYASCLYGPFRDALGSLGAKENPDTTIPRDKKTYQMNPANSREALRELELDIQEGADIVMVKPASFYLDIIAKFKEKSNVPVAAYQVSGEYAMIKCAAENNLIDFDQAMKESLISIKRAGADIILSYFAKDYLKTIH